MVLLQFWDSKTASDFYVNYNDTPVSFQPALFHLWACVSVCTVQCAVTSAGDTR